MTMIQVQAHLSSDELLKAVGQMSLPELEHFVSQVITLRAQREGPALPRTEAELLLKINEGIPRSLRQRFEQLVAKRQAEILSSDEQGELLRLTDQIEKIEARRVEYLAELAHLRHTTLSSLMKDLGVRAPAYE